MPCAAFQFACGTLRLLVMDSSGLHLYAFHSEYSSMQENCQIHKEVSVANVVKIVLDIFVDQEGAIRA
jgi:hypothetical protein